MIRIFCIFILTDLSLRILKKKYDASNIQICLALKRKKKTFNGDLP